MQQHLRHADTPGQIEAQLDQDRDALAESLNALRSRLSLEGLWSDGATLVKANAAPYTQALDAAIRANPVALAVTAVGLAWLILGRRKSPEGDPSSLAGSRFEAETRWEDEGGPVSDLPVADLPVADLPETDAAWMQEADTLRLRAAAMIARINTAVRDNLAPAADLAKIRSDVVVSLAKDIRRVMAKGLDTVSGGARDKILAAREQAYLMRISATKVGAETVRDNPVVAGLALAVAGATVAALLPRSAFENQVFGAPRDQVVGEAKRVLKDERQRVSNFVQGLSQALLGLHATSNPSAKD